MDPRLQEVLDSLLLNIAVLNEEVARLARTEQFSGTKGSLQLIESIRSQCVSSLQNLSTVERMLYKRKGGGDQGAAEIIRLE